MRGVEDLEVSSFCLSTYLWIYHYPQEVTLYLEKCAADDLSPETRPLSELVTHDGATPKTALVISHPSKVLDRLTEKCSKEKEVNLNAKAGCSTTSPQSLCRCRLLSRSWFAQLLETNTPAWKRVISSLLSLMTAAVRVEFCSLSPRLRLNKYCDSVETSSGACFSSVCVCV